ncbi:MAG: aminotransferase class III-fold pyridoxal phosphate-dependent enzyme, partial [Methanocorpusculaceae archaeon]|nr:aminotransferase class III-fold pyridoxal phosphate-dependent enzyme [Methanocorpusculaceae archaeon]
MNDAVCGKKSRKLFEEAKTLLPGGVASPVRAIQPYPFYTASALGCRLKTVDGLEYIDCCLGYGPLLLGHAHPSVTEAVSDQLTRGTLFGTPSELEIEL